MPHVSGRELDSKTFHKIFDKLIKTLEKAQKGGRLLPVLNELLTDTEKIMLAKRLAIVLMLRGKTPQHRISEALIVSPTTVNKMSRDVEIGRYDAILSISKAGSIDLERIVWHLLTAGGIMPPRVGGKYWRKYKRDNNL